MYCSFPLSLSVYHMLNFPFSCPPLGGPRDGPTVFFLCLGAGLLSSDIWCGYSGQMHAKRAVSDRICCTARNARRGGGGMDPHTPRPDSQPQAGVAARGAATTTTQRALTNFLAMPLTMTIKTTSGAQAQVGSMTELGELQTAACITRTRPRGSPGLRLGSC